MASQPSQSSVDDLLLASLTPEQRVYVERMQAELEARDVRVKQAEEREKQAREQERQAREQERQARADAAAFRKALADEQAERQSLEAGQTLDSYIAMEDRRHYYLPRLLPKIKTAQSKAKTTKTSTTTGRTSIVKKYYPLNLKRWDECDTVLSASFNRLRGVVNTQQVFPSKNEMHAFETRFLEDLPEEMVNAPLYLTELRTSFFLYEVLERPSSRILNAFLTGHKLFFDNMNAGAHVEYITQGRTQASSQSDGQSDGPSDGPSDGQSDGQSDNQIEVQVQTTNQSTDPTKKKKLKVPSKVQPDCVVLYATTGTTPAGTTSSRVAINAEESSAAEDGDDSDSEDSDGENSDGSPDIHRIAFGEHKPAHRLRGFLLNKLVERGIQQDYIVQMARRKATGFPKEDAKNRTNSFPGLVYYTYALAQTFHYMISAGILYGYLASGDTLTILHIHPDDPTTLLYQPYVFPEYAQVREAGVQPPATERTDAANLPIGRLCGMAVKARETGVMSERWRTAALEKLALFPHIPPQLAEDDTAAPPSDPPSSPGDDDRPDKRGFDGGDDDEDGGGDHGPGPSGRHLTTPHAYRPRVPSPLRGQESENHHSRQPWQQHSFFGLRTPVYLKPHRFDPASFQPIRPYCTQACLLGLARGLPLDDNCPNVFLHQRAACYAHYGGAMTADDVLPAQSGQTMHAIRSIEELGQLVVLQLYGNIVQDCQCLLSQGLRGKIGCLFKLTLTGYGYTFVAKGVQDFDRRRLQRETAVYDHLADQQGRLVPVYLGIVKLRLPYPMDDARLMSHLMLMSYGGPGMFARALQRRTRKGRDLAGVDLEEEADRTWKELEQLGVSDNDIENMDNNFTWCDEARRMMRIDFHCAGVSGHRVAAAGRRKTQQMQGQTQVPALTRESILATPSSMGTSCSPTVASFHRSARQRSIDSDSLDNGVARAAKRQCVLRQRSKGSMGSDY